MPEHWNTLAEWIQEETGVEEVTSEAFAGTPIQRMHYSELVDLWIEGLTTRYTKQAFFEEAQRRGITVAPVNSALDLDRRRAPERNERVGASAPLPESVVPPHRRRRSTSTGVRAAVRRDRRRWASTTTTCSSTSSVSPKPSVAALRADGRDLTG